MPIKLDVPLIAQEKPNCCWHTAAMVIWLYHQHQTHRQGPMNTVPEAYKRADVEPLYWAEFITLAKNIGMLGFPMANNYAVAGLTEMLTRYGPLWCCGLWYGVSGNSAAFLRARWMAEENAGLGNTVSVLG